MGGEYVWFANGQLTLHDQHVQRSSSQLKFTILLRVLLIQLYPGFLGMSKVDLIPALLAEVYRRGLANKIMIESHTAPTTSARFHSA